MGRILVVDDDDGMRHTMFRLLHRAGHDVELATDGKDCLEVIRSVSIPVDLVLTDLYMPDKDGLELLCELRREFPKVAVVAMCGNRNWQLMLKAAKGLGAVRTLEKPFTSEVLLAVVAEELNNQEGNRNKPADDRAA